MSDLDEQPAVPPMDEGGDERIGGFAAGAALIVGGWGVLLGLNVVLHRWAGQGGLALGPLRIFSTFGPFAIATAALGAVGGIIGVAMVYYATTEPAGKFVLPGQSY